MRSKFSAVASPRYHQREAGGEEPAHIAQRPAEAGDLAQPSGGPRSGRKAAMNDSPME
jgi:hypothetical protein